MKKIAFLNALKDTYLRLTLEQETQVKFKQALSNEFRRQSRALPFFTFLGFISVLFVSSGFLFIVLGSLNSSFVFPTYVHSQLIAGAISLIVGVICSFVVHNYFSNLLLKVSNLRESTNKNISLNSIFKPIFDQISEEQALFIREISSISEFEKKNRKNHLTGSRRHRETSMDYH